MHIEVWRQIKDKAILMCYGNNCVMILTKRLEFIVRTLESFILRLDTRFFTNLEGVRYPMSIMMNLVLLLLAMDNLLNLRANLLSVLQESFCLSL